MLDIPLLRLDDDTDEPLAAPRRIRAGDAAADLPARHGVELAPGARELVPTGFAVAVPAGYCGLILPRSGLALRHGITVLNAPGLIDSGYRGELKVKNHGKMKMYFVNGPIAENGLEKKSTLSEKK